MTKNSIIVAFLIGLAVPFVAFATLLMVAEQAQAWGFVPDAGAFRTRTLVMLAICFNLLPMRIFRLRKQDESMRGIVIATALCAAAWIFFFWKEIM